MVQWKIGDVTVTRIVERDVAIAPQGLLPRNYEPAALERHRSWLQPHFVDADDLFLLAIQALIVDTGTRRVLVDTCLGNRVNPYMERIDTPFPEWMAEAGYPRESIDTVVCTHLHFDHVGWNTMEVDGRWVPTFPNARYLFGRVEWEHWQVTGSDILTLADTVQPVVDAGLADLVEVDHRICDEIWLEPTPGHTPGHVSVRISSQGEDAVITGDMTHHPIQLAETQLGSGADSFPEEATATRRSFVERYGGTPTLVIGTHFPTPCAGTLVRDGAGWRLQV